MTKKFIITNRTDKPMQAVITDNDTGNNVLQRELHPGCNELFVNDLHQGIYIIHLEDANHEIIYQQKIFKD
ncbi:hypothetical protein CAP35_09380 [Chitinophagaceae bacterium IBVUCB1]|nr:hypothetical protein CAP35_09380 [Chitinophagaceae bacterium IBVUCB1]